ncbi:MAG: carbohydrate ABC transporter permease, partial [Bacteroidota bacterium]
MKKIKLQKFLFYLLLLGMTALYLGPFLFSLSISFNADQNVFDWPLKLVPERWTLNNYKNVWESLPFAVWLKNSVFITIIQTICNVFFAALAGFAFARLKFPGKNIIFSILLASLMIPG